MIKNKIPGRILDGQDLRTNSRAGIAVEKEVKIEALS